MLIRYIILQTKVIIDSIFIIFFMTPFAKLVKLPSFKKELILSCLNETKKKILQLKFVCKF